MLKLMCLVLALTLLSAYTSVPENITPVTGFEKARYLGKWHEIALWTILCELCDC